MKKENEAYNLARNLIRVGFVNSIDAKQGTVKVLLPDKDNSVTDDLPMLSFEYHMPKVGDQVLCLFLGNGMEQGFCLGSFFSKVNMPPADKEIIYKKKIDDNMIIEYNKETKFLKVNVESAEITINNGVVTINADKILLGSDGAIEGVPLGETLKEWLDSHTHPAPGGTTSRPSISSPSPSMVVKTI